MQNVDEEIDSTFETIDYKKVSTMQDRINEKKAQSFADTFFARADLVDGNSYYSFDPDICVYQSNMCSISAGMYFSLPIIGAIKTLVFELHRRADYNTHSMYLVLEKLESIIKYDENGRAVAEEFYVDIPKINGNFLAFLHIDSSKSEVFINNGVLEGNKVLISKKPTRLFYGKARKRDTNGLNLSAYSTSEGTNITDSTEVMFPADINDMAAVFIDPETASLIRREIYYDEKTNMRKARIKLSTNKPYIVFRFYEKSSKEKKEYEASKRTGRRPLNNMEKARLFRSGEDDFPKDSAIAAMYYEKSSNPNAAYELATLFRDEEDLRDVELYNEYLLKAINSGNASALCEYALAYYKSLTEEIQDEIMDMLMCASNAGHEIANYVIAYLIETGIAAGGNEKAFTFYHNAAKHHFLPACARLGCCDVEGIPESELKRGFMDNAEYGKTIADYGLGCMYFFGIDMYPDRAHGLKLLEKAAESGNRMAAKTLFEIYDNFPEYEDKKVALEWLKRIVKLTSHI
ncbi:MAG: sel1 repeat family protein [Christensenellaceae bacterium]|nr:sel1 repeat family protein [Christensenellaceae bacterium]